MSVDVKAIAQIQLAIKVAIENLVGFLADHLRTTLLSIPST